MFSSFGEIPNPRKFITHNQDFPAAEARIAQIPHDCWGTEHLISDMEAKFNG